MIAIIALVSAVILGSFESLRTTKLLDTESAAVVTLLSDARERTLSSVNSSRYGVHIETARAVLFAGTAFVDGAPSNEARTLDARVSIANIALTGGASDIVFKRLSGEVSATGTIDIKLVSDPTLGIRVRVEQTGIVSTESI